MNPVVILTRNNLDLTRRCIESVRNQTIPNRIIVFDNGSNDGTKEFIYSSGIDWFDVRENKGVSVGWNTCLNFIFNEEEAKHALVIGNDVVLPRWFYFELLEYNVPFVTGVAIDRMVIDIPERMPLTQNPDFSAFLIRKGAWDAIGPFNETMKLYCSDTDYHVRAHRLGIPLLKANAPYFHVPSATIRNAPPDERNQLLRQADADRDVFRRMYNCLPGTVEYAKLFQ